ncbi:MAG: hypothetical protein JOZ44_19835 [Acidobacteria bacterium]|nr:hypothetical protein [Acidobacteriota bacterium]
MGYPIDPYGISHPDPYGTRWDIPSSPYGITMTFDPNASSRSAEQFEVSWKSRRRIWI